MNLIIGLVAAAVGLAAGYAIRKFVVSQSVTSAENRAEKLVAEAETKKKEMILAAKDEAIRVREEAKKDEKERLARVSDLEQKFHRREELFDQKQITLDRKSQQIEQDLSEITKTKEKLSQAKQIQDQELQKVAGLSRDQAKELLFKKIEVETSEELAKRVRQLEAAAKEESDRRAREIIGVAIQRYSAEQTTETTVSTLSLGSDELKGRIIGREGRNIQAFEKATGVDLIVDDTPETVVISCFDPVRRAVAKLALEKLIADGRIHPARIEETVEKAEKEINNQIKEAGEAAVYEVGVGGLPPDLIKLLGRLKYRTSYGQNVLRHSVEVANFAVMLASEIGADVGLVKKAALLHDIGKAIDHEVSGSHAQISRDIAKKYGLPDAVVHAIEAHHEEVGVKSMEAAILQTVEALIVQAADAISASRPGARRESLENYLRRVAELENIANSFTGVEKSYAIQAGREIRILVKPEEISDLEAIKLGNNIVSKIEQELEYPGQIKVTVIRETRAIDFAK